MKAIKKNIQLRDSKLEAKETEGKKYLVGLIPYNSRSVDMGYGQFEKIAPTAFNKTLSDGFDVRALYDHDDSKILGSVKSGTLVLRSTELGLECTCELPNTTYANDLFEIVSRGDVRTMSFGFTPVKYTDEGDTRILREVKLDEVSFGVMFAAYPETNSETIMRSYMKRNNINPNKIVDIINEEAPEITEEQITEVKKLVESLNSLIKKPEDKTAKPSPDEKRVDEKPKKEEDVKKESVEETTPNEDTSEKEDLDKLALEMEIEDELNDEVVETE